MHVSWPSNVQNFSNFTKSKGNHVDRHEGFELLILQFLQISAFHISIYINYLWIVANVVCRIVPCGRTLTDSLACNGRNIKLQQRPCVGNRLRYLVVFTGRDGKRSALLGYNRNESWPPFQVLSTAFWFLGQYTKSKLNKSTSELTQTQAIFPFIFVVNHLARF
jgi:hypothetical protein